MERDYISVNILQYDSGWLLFLYKRMSRADITETGKLTKLIFPTFFRA
jgi:hypothetical protein